MLAETLSMRMAYLSDRPQGHFLYNCDQHGLSSSHGPVPARHQRSEVALTRKEVRTSVFLCPSFRTSCSHFRVYRLLHDKTQTHSSR